MPHTTTQRVEMTRWVVFFFQLSSLDAHPIRPGIPSTHDECPNDHPPCHIDTLGGFLVPLPLDDDPPTTQRVEVTRWVGFSSLSTTTSTPNVSNRHVGWVSQVSALDALPISPSTRSTHEQRPNDHPTCQYDTLGGFLDPHPLDDDPPTTQRVEMTRWVGFSTLWPRRPPNGPWNPFHPRRMPKRPPNVSY